MLAFIFSLWPFKLQDYMGTNNLHHMLRKMGIKMRTNLSNKVDSDALVFDFLCASAHVDDDLASNCFILQVDIKMLGLLIASNFYGPTALSNVENDGRLRGATEQPRLEEFQQQHLLEQENW